MTEDEIYKGLQDILRRALGMPNLVPTRETSAASVKGWDSVRQVVIILEVEERFGITLRSREIDRLRNVGDFLDLVKIKLVR